MDPGIPGCGGVGVWTPSATASSTCTYYVLPRTCYVWRCVSLCVLAIYLLLVDPRILHPGYGI